MRELFGIDAVVLVFAAVNGFDIERMGQDEGQAGSVAFTLRPIAQADEF